MLIGRTFIIGNLGGDAALRYTPEGRAVCSFSVAFTQKWRNSDGKLQEKTAWYECHLWEKQAETLQPMLLRGTKVYAEGCVEAQAYIDSKGTAVGKLVMRSVKIELLSRKPGSVEETEHEADGVNEYFEIEDSLTVV